MVSWPSPTGKQARNRRPRAGMVSSCSWPCARTNLADFDEARLNPPRARRRGRVDRGGEPIRSRCIRDRVARRNQGNSNGGPQAWRALCREVLSAAFDLPRDDRHSRRGQTSLPNVCPVTGRGACPLPYRQASPQGNEHDRPSAAKPARKRKENDMLLTSLPTLCRVPSPKASSGV